MLDRLLRLYRSGALEDAAIDKAVALGWITSEQRELFKEEDINAND